MTNAGDFLMVYDAAFKGVQRFSLPEKGTEFKADVIGDASMPFSTTEPLCDFIKWSVEKYPAKNYILILWVHGEGWSYQTDTGTKACLVDDNIDRSGRTPFCKMFLYP